MVSCTQPVVFPYFIVSRKHREDISIHYAFVGNKEKYKEQLEKISSGNLPSKEIKDVFGDITKIWESIIKKNEPLIFIYDMIWLDDTIFQIKRKLFVYLSKENNYLLPERQQLWTKDIILGNVFEKDMKTIRYKPALDEKPFIENEFLSEDNERTNVIQVENQENILLYDIFLENNISSNQLFVYSLDDELMWLVNNPLLEDNKQVSRDRLQYGYIVKHWPFTTKKSSNLDILKQFNQVKSQVTYSKEIISSFREHEKTTYKPLLEDCFILTMVLYSRPPKIEDKPYRLNLIYNYLRTLLSDDIPYIHYTSPGLKKPFISIHEDSIKKGDLKMSKVKEWLFKKVVTGLSGEVRYKTKTSTSGIVIKIKIKKNIYKTLTLFPNGDLKIGLYFDEETKANIKSVEKSMKKITDLVKTINNNLLIYHKHPLYNVPSINVVDGEFKLSEYTDIQFYKVVSSFQSPEIDLEDFSTFVDKYKPFGNISLLSEENEIIIRYNRTSKFEGLADIFEFIKKEKPNYETEKIIEMISKIYGKTRIQAVDIYKKWEILKNDPQSGRKLLKHPGVTIKLVRKEDTNKIIVEGLNSYFILRNCHEYFQNLIYFYFKPTREKKISLQEDITFNFGFNNNFLPPKKEVEEILTNFSNFSSTEGVDMEDESVVDPKLRLKCRSEEDKLVERGVCKDVCEFPNFKLSRLQKFDSSVFKFQTKRNDPYSRLCPEFRRPLVMAYNPDKNPKIDKKSYTYSLEYGSKEKKFHYICPQAWCPICDVPVPLEKVKNIQEKDTKEGKCRVGICPNGNHQVIINNKYGKDDIYPGFLDAGKHPQGFCMPCCFKKDSRLTSGYKRCISDEDISVEEKKYVSIRSKIPLEEGRFGLLSKEAEVFLDQKKCEKGIIKNGFNCYVRKGVRPNPKESFMLCLLDILSGITGEKITKEMLLKKLASSLTKTLFQSLNGGMIKRIFKTEANFKEYLTDPDTIISNIYLWDFVTRPNIFTKEGFNIVLFTPFSISCPYGQSVLSLYSMNRPTALVVRNGNWYEPIYKLEYVDTKLSVYPLQNSLQPEIQKCLEIIMDGCKPYDQIDWNKITGEKSSKELTLEEALKFNVKLQIIDKYSKTTAVILDSGLYLPIEPTPIDKRIPFSEDFDVQTLDTTIKNLEKINMKPELLVVYKKNPDLVIGLLLESKRMIPVKPTKLSKTKIQVSDAFYYLEEKNDNSTKEKRIQALNKYRYKLESFERYKYEFSRYLQVKPKYKESIIENLKNKKELKKIIEKINSKILASPAQSKKTVEEAILNNYKSKLVKKACFEGNKDDHHCVCIRGSCKLATLPDIQYTERILDILYQYKIKRKEIIEGTISMIDISTALDKIQRGEILLTGNKIDEQFSKLIFDNKDTIQLRMIQNIEMLEPTFEGIEKKLYLKERKEVDTKLFSVIDISDHWTPIMDPSFRVISTKKICNSLFYIFSELAKRVSGKNNYKERVDVSSITDKNIRSVYTDFILKMKPEELQKIAKLTIKDLPEEDIFDVSDFYNAYNNEKISSSDDLVERIKAPTYKPTKFDLILMTYMLNIYVVLLRTSISEIIGKGFVDNELYSILFYTDTEECMRFYMLNKRSVPYLTKFNKIIKKLTT